ncbi:uncharacterized protein LOC136066726 [Quercus suber]|uniref:uncharacterized protein LOC136066726 n=1 Tax=Quercus suber TaxID=58331 RepID=UPI0032DFDC5C
MITAYTPPAKSFYANTWKNMVDPSRLQIPFVSTWEDGMHFSKGLTFANKEAVKRALIIYAAKDNRNFIIQRYCGPVISIDETHLYGKYRGVLMIARATDADQKVLPLAFVVVDKESGLSWGWFLECLRGSIGHVILDEGICIISDRHKGIKYTIAEWLRGDDGSLRVFHRYCLQHVASNFNTHFDDLTLKALALKAGYVTHEAKFESIMQTIKDVEINALRGVELDDPHIARYMPYTYLISEDLDKWTQSHDGERRYGAMTTNIFECFNRVLKGSRSLPIAAMVEFTWCKLVAYFHDQHKEIISDLSQGKKISGHTLRNFNHETGVYQVVTSYNDHRGGGGNHNHEVHVFARTCDYGKWQNIKIPCSHAIKVLQGLHLDVTSYIDPCYSLDNTIHTYAHQFVVSKSESLWRDVRGPRWVPDPQLL